MPRYVLSCLVACLLAFALAACQQQPVAVAPPEATPQEYFAAGMQAYNAEDYNQAATQFDTAIRMAPGMAEAYWYQGMCYANMGMKRRAEDVFRNGLAVAPGYVRLHEALGILSYGMGNYPQARAELAQASSMGSTEPKVYLYLGKLAMSDGDCEGAIANFNRALTLDPGMVPARQDLAAAQAQCRPQATPTYRSPRPRVQKSFTGGGRALDPSEF